MGKNHRNDVNVQVPNLLVQGLNVVMIEHGSVQLFTLNPKGRSWVSLSKIFNRGPKFIANVVR